MEMSWTNGRTIMMMRMTQIGDDDDPDARVTMTRTGGDDDDDDDSRTPRMPPTPPTDCDDGDGDGDGERCGDDNDQEDGDDDHHDPNASGPWTPSPMTQAAVYNSVAYKVGMKPKQVKDVAEAMIALVAKQLKSCGTFKIAGALNLKLKRSQSKKPASFGANLKMTIRATLLKKMTTMMTTPPADADSKKLPKMITVRALPMKKFREMVAN